MKKFAVVFWLVDGSHMEIVEAENKNEACDKIEEKYKNRYCEVMFAQFHDWVK